MAFSISFFCRGTSAARFGPFAARIDGALISMNDWRPYFKNSSQNPLIHFDEILIDHREKFCVL